MPAPILKWLGEGQGGTRFKVLSEGAVNRRWYAAGDIIVCVSGAMPGDDVVLVARGIGRPRIGRLESTGMIGSSGERCHPARWSCAGRVAAVQASQAPTQLYPSAQASQHPAAREPQAQLSLFAA
ncbi:MAG: hypothetical protein ACI9K2_000551 [Myxococcota bacterium]|jgi:hypothetical protein